MFLSFLVYNNDYIGVLGIMAAFSRLKVVLGEALNGFRQVRSSIESGFFPNWSNQFLVT